MALFFYPVFFLISQLLLLSFAEEESNFNHKCAPFSCGKLGLIGFPFSNRTSPDCGLLIVHDCDKPVQKIRLAKDGPLYTITSIHQDITLNNTVTLEDRVFQDQLHSRSCESFKTLTLPGSSFLQFEIISNLTLLKCSRALDHKPTDLSLPCDDSIIYYNHPNHDLPSLPPQCSLIQLPVKKNQNSNDLFNLLTGLFTLRVYVPMECGDCLLGGGRCHSDTEGNFNCAETKECHDCHRGGGKCIIDYKKGFQCLYTRTENENMRLMLGFGLGFGIGIPTLWTVFLFIMCLHKRQYASANLHSGNSSSIPSSKSDLETGTVYFGVPIFSYDDLAEATNYFNHDKELGDGGFGTVYHGKLRDGREVAVKRLYEHNYRRVEQFLNEIEILTRLHHKNLLSLYGCTSRHSQGLLLVYEFVPNGTVADHLRGDRAKPGFFTWPMRMNIAIETASALAYLHASDIIHRDVKTNNILLDNNFCVKVADFGLSRLFPNDVTHISTAPQGTPGYVDPEYHQCYQLTKQSDVYSFGVVLIELISSMPAVDISRHRYEINLANLAINRIQKDAIDELIDPCLGYHLDKEVKRMATSVAELAFQCLQQNKEMRPSMDVVLEVLQRIQSGEPNFENQKENQDDGEVLKTMQPPPSPPYCDGLALLKYMRMPSSPI